MRSPTRTEQQLLSAFAVIEVVLAIGIAGFVLAAILGLCSVALRSSNDSADDTVLAEITNAILGELRAESFFEQVNQPTLLLHGQSELASVPDSVSDSSALPTIVQNRYYDTSGVRLMKGNRDIQETDVEFKDAAYRCRLTLQGDYDTLSTSSGSFREINLLNVRLEFFWPVQANKSAKEKVFHGAVSRN